MATPPIPRTCLLRLSWPEVPYVCTSSASLTCLRGTNAFRRVPAARRAFRLASRAGPPLYRTPQPIRERCSHCILPISPPFSCTVGLSGASVLLLPVSFRASQYLFSRLSFFFFFFPFLSLVAIHSFFYPTPPTSSSVPGDCVSSFSSSPSPSLPPSFPSSSLSPETLFVMASVNGSFASPAADATVTPRLFQAGGLVSAYLENLNAWKAILTLFLAAVIYDQSE